MVYVTGDVGGPTLVTTQRLTSKRLADRGWIVHPRVNRVCMFDGGVLHGVIPGRGVPQPAPLPPLALTVRGDAATQAEHGGGSSGGGGGGGGPDKADLDQSGVFNPAAGKKADRRDEATRGGAARGSDGCSGGGSDEPSRKNSPGEREGMRVTWMVAFWRDIQSRPPVPQPKPKTPREASSRPPSGAGAAQPFPKMPHPKDIKRPASAGRGNEPTWPALFRKKPEDWGCCVPAGGGEGPADGMMTTPVTPVPVPRVWEDVDEAENRRVGGAVTRLKRLPEYDLCFQGF